MIASYGDSTNTSWIDPRYTVWRHDKTGAAIGYQLQEHRFIVIWGRPLCHKEDLPRVIQAFLQHCDRERLRPIWCCVDQGTEEHLTKRYGWRGLSCIAEARVDPSKAEGEKDSNVKKKIQQAKNAGVQIVAVDGEMPDQMKAEIEKHIKEWGDNRKGTQMHITDVRPWDDPKHRKYFYAKSKDNQVSRLYSKARRADSSADRRPARLGTTCSGTWTADQMVFAVPWRSRRYLGIHAVRGHEGCC